jgi:hypothetical protein
MIIWDEKDPWGPNAKDRCVICLGRLHLPVAAWNAGHVDDEGYTVAHEAFICNECCHDMCRGFSIDMKQIVTAKKVERLGFRHASKQAAVSGGFLYAGTGNKQ